MNENPKAILDTKVPEHSLALWWLGQMGLMVKTGKTLICVDYFATPGYGRLTPPIIPAEELTGVDVFLGTHDHLDHIDHCIFTFDDPATPPESTYINRHLDLYGYWGPDHQMLTDVEYDMTLDAVGNLHVFYAVTYKAD